MPANGGQRKDLTSDINGLLIRVYREMTKDFESVIVTGPGSRAVEAMLASFAPRESATLVITNGVYGERMASMLEAQGKPHYVVSSEWGEPIDMDRVRAKLELRTDITHAAAVHHETSTGQLNDLTELSELFARQDIRLMLDAVSSFGAEAIDADAWKFAALAATADKCLHGEPGVSFVLARKQMWADELVPAGSADLDLTACYQDQHGAGSSPSAHAGRPAIALLEALRELEDIGGWEQRRSVYRRRAGLIAVTLKELGLETLLPPQDYSCALWSWLLPDGDSYERVHGVLKQHGFDIHAGQGDLGERVFRIAHMGDINNDDLARLDTALRECFTSPTA